MKLSFNSLLTRIVFFFTVLLILVQALTFFLVNAANRQIARNTITQELDVGERIFLRLLDKNREQLEQSAVLLAADFAFRTAVGTNDTATILSALGNHGARASASVMMLVSLDDTVLADTLHPEPGTKRFAFQHLIRAAENEGKSSGIVTIDGKLYQLVVVPVLAPATIAWVGVGFNIDDKNAEELKKLTALDVSFLSRSRGAVGSAWQLRASTLPERLRGELVPALSGNAAIENSHEISLLGEDYEASVATIEKQGESQTVAVLQRSMAEGFKPFRRVSFAFLFIAIASVFLSVIGSILIARNITQPIIELAGIAQQIEQGDYTQRVALKQKGEIGVLASSFNHMLEGIAAREKENLRLAFEDHLTTLPNRTRFYNHLIQVLLLAGRSGSGKDKSTPFCVMILDLDRFKNVNDTLGHPIGDQVLREVASMLRALLHDADMIARLGGDEFAILLYLGDTEHAMVNAQAAAQKILQMLETPIVIDEQAIDVGTSIGIALFPDHAGTADALLQCADIAMYAAKRSKSGYAIYDERLEEHREEHLTLRGELRRAVAHNELVLHYQPKYDISKNIVTSAEALVRWQHPLRGNITPSEFIPFAEQTGYIRIITRWVINAAVEQCGAWHAAGHNLEISVNISARDLLDKELVAVVGEALRKHHVPPHYICIEITESALMEDPIRARATLKQLHALGVKLSMDDYGTGYSSLAYIRNLDLDELKIDRAFITNVNSDKQNAAIVRSTIELGHSLGMIIVAEGVETREELETLKVFGCDYAQGYQICRPLNAADLTKWLVSV